jgi:Retroviral aspartyl protease
MEIAGRWVEHEDGGIRPMVWVNVDGADGARRSEFFLLDTGADQIVFSAGFFQMLQLPTVLPTPEHHLEGISGRTDFALARTALLIDRTDGGTLRMEGTFGVFLRPEATDYSLLGRDVLDHFDVVIRRQRADIRLLIGNHTCQIVTP